MRRKLPRFDLSQPVTLTVLVPEKTRLEGTLANVSEAGYKLLVGQELRAGTAVEVDLPDAMLLGEVRYCVAEPDGRFGVGLENVQILSNMGELARLVNGIMGASASRDRAESEKAMTFPAA